jgi:tetratricopeptide (TPR) repeat protein
LRRPECQAFPQGKTTRAPKAGFAATFSADALDESVVSFEGGKELLSCGQRGAQEQGNMAISDAWLRYAPKPRELSGGDAWNVFLSYRSVNRAWVLNLYDVLRELKHKVFLDQCVLKAGDELTKHLEEALKTSQAGVLIWSSATQDSGWVRREYEVLERQATRKPGFQFVPLRLDSSALPGFAESRVFLDFSTYPDGPNGGELLRLLHAIVGRPLSYEAASFAAQQDEAAQEAANKINAAIRIGNAKRLQQLFEQSGLPWQTSAMLGCKAAEGLTKLGCTDEAIAMLIEIEKNFRKAIRPKQLRALALARRSAKTGNEQDLAAAQDILAELYESGERDPETLGILARTWMDRYDRTKQTHYLRQSRSYYASAFAAAQDDYYTGINAASKSVFLGTPDDLNKAMEYAKRVQDIVDHKIWPEDYWKTATVAEALLIQKQYQEAAHFYEEAVALAPNDRGSHETTWTQARRLMEKLEPSTEERALIAKPFEHLQA